VLYHCLLQVLRDAITCNEVDVIPAFLHAVYVLLEVDLLIARLGGVLAHELCNLGEVVRILRISIFFCFGFLFWSLH